MAKLRELPDGTQGEFPDDMSEEEINQAIASNFPGGEQVPPPAAPGEPEDNESLISKAAGFLDPRGILENILGTAEAGISVGTSIVSDIAGGVAGLATGLITDDSEAAQAVQEGIAEDFTFVPRGEEGQERLEQVGELLAPVGEALQEAESFLGDAAFEATGSPAFAAAATVLPTAVLEILGVKGTRVVRNLRRNRVSKQLGKEVDAALAEATPSTKKIKQVARGVFKEIDDLGASVKPGAFTDMVDGIRKTLKKEGLDPEIHEITQSALNALERAVPPKPPKPKRRVLGQRPTPPPGRRSSVNLQSVENLRKVAQDAAAKATVRGDLADARLSNVIIDKIDGFMDAAGVNAINFPKGIPVNIGQAYKGARELWSRAKKSELMADALERATRQKSGLENGIRIKLQQMIDNKRQRRFFNKGEKKAIQEVINGTKTTNLFTFMSKFGVDLSQATRGAVGTGLGGAAGAVLLPVFGTVSVPIARALTKRGARLADGVIRAGRDGRKLAEAYIRLVPRAERTAVELS